MYVCMFIFLDNRTQQHISERKHYKVIEKGSPEKQLEEELVVHAGYPKRNYKGRIGSNIMVSSLQEICMHGM